MLLDLSEPVAVRIVDRRERQGDKLGRRTQLVHRGGVGALVDGGHPILHVHRLVQRADATSQECDDSNVDARTAASDSPTAVPVVAAIVVVATSFSATA